jgi:hypothetical protein
VPQQQECHKDGNILHLDPYCEEVAKMRCVRPEMDCPERHSERDQPDQQVNRLEGCNNTPAPGRSHA